MGFLTYSSFSSAFPSVYSEAINTIQRSTVLLRLLKFTKSTTGQAAQWLVKADGSTGSAVSLDGGALPTPANNARFGASLPLAGYATASEITELAKMAGANYSGNPNLYADLVNQAIAENACQLAKTLNQQLYTGTGSSNQMVGLSEVVSAGVSGDGNSTAIYAGINPGSVSSWEATRDGYNNGTAVSITLGAMRGLLSDVRDASGQKADIMVCNPSLFNSIIGQFEQRATTFYSGSDVLNPVPAVRTAAGVINADNFRAVQWMNEGVVIVEDPDCQNINETNTTGVLYAFNSNLVDIVYMDPTPGSDLQPARTQALQTQDMGQLAKFPVKVQERPNASTYASIIDMFGACSLRVKQRNAVGVLVDVK